MFGLRVAAGLIQTASFGLWFQGTNLTPLLQEVAGVAWYGRGWQRPPIRSTGMAGEERAGPVRANVQVSQNPSSAPSRRHQTRVDA